MATGDGVTEWIDVADFTPGIHSGTRSFATGTPESATDGVAQVRDTWGCVANPNGGLEPAPTAEQLERGNRAVDEFKTYLRDLIGRRGREPGRDEEIRR